MPTAPPTDIFSNNGDTASDNGLSLGFRDRGINMGLGLGLMSQNIRRGNQMSMDDDTMSVQSQDDTARYGSV